MKIQVSGRLGNQLFQWAFAHELAEYFNESVTPVVDPIHFPIGQNSIYVGGLSKCCHIGDQISSRNLGYILKFFDKLKNINQKIAIKVWNLAGFYRESDAYTVPILEKLTKKPRFLTGFYISELYVLKHRSHLHEMLTEKFTKESELISSKIDLPDAFQAVHVRRGDFSSLKDSFGLLSRDWYLQNLDQNLPIVLATDDLLGARDVISAISPQFILDPANFSPWETLGILSKAKQIVLSNSTFGWWSGFCAAENGGTVIYPHPFYKSSKDDQLSLSLPNVRKCQSFFE